MDQKSSKDRFVYKAWIGYQAIGDAALRKREAERFRWIASSDNDETVRAAVSELVTGIGSMFGADPQAEKHGLAENGIILGTFQQNDRLREICGDAAIRLGADGFVIRTSGAVTAIGAHTAAGVLYGAFHLLRLLAHGRASTDLDVIESPANGLRMINQWDNIDGSIERGYAGQSIFYRENAISFSLERIRDYARLLASVGLNAISINNVNVHKLESRFVTKEYLPQIAELASIFRVYGIKLFLSINFASPIEVGGLQTADPLDPEVRGWWRERAAEIYESIPDFGGFLVKADSENRPGPFTYDRNHADGANMLAEALELYGGVIIWRCFVYNCKQDWRDRSTDRARAAYDHFMPLDGAFKDNVILQIKNGPMDFQVREPVSPLLGAMKRTNQIIELQISQEYTGQQRHLCYLVPQWKSVLDFETFAKGQGEASPVRRIVDGSAYGRPYGGFAAVSNIGDDANWTGHPLAQANLYGYGRLAWNPQLSSEEIAEEWVMQTLGSDEAVVSNVCGMLMESLDIYESYTAPLGVGWMVSPNHHYGPSVDGYEYDKWGTYHFADRYGIGVDRTVKSGTGYTSQYFGGNAEVYESLDRCPDELLLFFHHVPYTHVLKSGNSVIQHIYNTHFEGADRAEKQAAAWRLLRNLVDEEMYAQVEARLLEQAEHAKEWRDTINTYFYRKSGIADELGRTIY
ncbi:alpha-glucuronidase family glycosyl hydrolase [Paenibacillus sp. PL91]|uniref:alpha-glucuronidase family glycosyl hydrolase n=1 Tax=Paenibacillus sp. PL91 TaxID=2729538 RepID=UPI00145C9EC6|nr:alpha-glucuronidase family glycosyl hydrolase [Paenibacillus sp. PL91]MBC9200754.1 alpha-glucuronidase [Paenibacillus sp. PL91]